MSFSCEHRQCPYCRAELDRLRDENERLLEEFNASGGHEGEESINLTRIQKQHREWADYNFPGAASWQPLLGVGEELGELDHAFLKLSQGIRGSNEELRAEMKDAVGDLLIYLIDFCSKEEIDLAATLAETWEHVRQRDWQKYPLDGMTK